ncbi:thioester reductase domain-containing protein [Longispora sp. NPDC051575]|uniref:thioester reductase domain-containing protein n=1 Tax=Longispora sp. NPDC051575 TaxID=3154943 RepID=UPI00341873E6
MSDIVMVTGATGFLGGHVCAELLKHTDVEVRCLVRGRTRQGAWERLTASLAFRGITPEQLTRVALVHADLREPRLGLHGADYYALARAISAIYHCGASVNLAADYERLAPANIGGTRTILELAAHAGATTHYVSSVGVFVDAYLLGHPEVDEDTALVPGMAGEVGYTRSKYDAEQLVRASGLPAVIYRPGFITGDHRTGECSDTDLISRAIRAAATVGTAPDCHNAMPVAPVDHVARSLVALSRQPASIGRSYHLTTPEMLPMADVFTALRAHGHHLDAEPVPQWRATLRANQGEPDAFAMLALWATGAYLLEEIPRYRICTVRSERTNAELNRLGIPSPSVDAAYLDRVMRYLTDTKALDNTGLPVAV